MQTAATVNPLTYVVNAERAAFTGALGDPSILYGAIAAALDALGIAKQVFEGSGSTLTNT